MEFDAFISYSSDDKAAADAACAVLEGAGIRCWVAPRDILPGHQYGAAIVDAIDRCRVMVLIFSASANESNQVHREIERAVSKGVPIVPVRIESVQPTKSMEYFLGSIHWLDALTPPIENHLQRLAVTVRAILNAGVAEASSPNASGTANVAAAADGATRVPPRTGLPLSKDLLRSRWLRFALGGAACVALLAASAWLYRDHSQSVIGAAPPRPILVPESVPFISDQDRLTIRTDYLPAKDHKALAISVDQMGFVTNQSDDDSAIATALERCQKSTAAAGRTDVRCQLYALGNSVVYLEGRPPLPPQPWLVRNVVVERPFAVKDVPLVPDNTRSGLAGFQAPNNFIKALAITPHGAWSFRTGPSGPAEAVRRALEGCGAWRQGACMIVAVGDRFVVAIPTTMRAVGFFNPETSEAIAGELRDETARKLAGAANGWNAVAVGSGGRPGLALNASDEPTAVGTARAECNNHDHNCRVIAIGPFLVAPQN